MLGHFEGAWSFSAGVQRKMRDFYSSMQTPPDRAPVHPGSCASDDSASPTGPAGTRDRLR